MKILVKLGALAATAAAGAIAYKAKEIIEDKIPLPNDFTITAHSGSESTPDNSMEFIKKAISLNVDVLEVDVTFRKDNTPVIIHKDVAENDEGVLFDEAMKYISENSGSVLVNLDLKAFHNLESVIDIVKKYNLLDRCFFTGVRAEHAQIVNETASEIPHYLNMSFNGVERFDKKHIHNAVKQVKECNAIGINCNYAFASKDMVKIFREEGLKISYWTADTKPLMKYLVSLGPDNITTHYPMTLRKMLSK